MESTSGLMLSFGSLVAKTPSKLLKLRYSSLFFFLFLFVTLYLLIVLMTQKKRKLMFSFILVTCFVIFSNFDPNDAILV